MSEKTQSLKQAHEINICQEFLLEYNLKKDFCIDLVRTGEADANEPDCICTESFAIELFGVYDNEYQAEKIWSVSRKKKVFQKAEYKLSSLDNLQSIIGRKLIKLNKDYYSGFPGKIILLCNLQSPLLEDHEIMSWVDKYASYKEDGHFEKYFYEIWVMWKSDTDGSIKIQKLE